MAGRVALQKYALAGRPPGSFFRNLPRVLPKLFQLMAVIVATFPLASAQTATFQLVAQVDEAFQLGV